MKYRRMLGGGEHALPLAKRSANMPRLEAAKAAAARLRAWISAGGTGGPTRASARARRAMDDLVNFLGTRPFFYADRLSMADLGVYGMFFTMRRDSIPGSARLLADRPSLVAFMARVEEVTGGAGS
jgi:glutathione S-transferase